MATTYYELLGVSSTASPGEIRTAFRRQIARYHPDKTQHLGVEFQNMAAVRSAELTQAYKILTDEALRADYDASVRSELARPRHAPTPPSPPDSTTMVVRTGVSDLVRRAAVGRFRHALHAEFGSCEEAPVQGFEVVCAPSRARLWSKLPPRMYVRFVRDVDAVAVSESWAMVSRVREKADERELCVFLMGPSVAPAAELARAIAHERRKPAPAGLELTIVPVNTRSWMAHVPNDAPSAVKSLIARLGPS